MPLRPDDATRARAPADSAVLRVAVDSLHHPLLPAVRFDATDGLSAEEAALVAVVANPQLRAVRARRGVARAGLVAAGILPNPTFDFEADAPVGRNTAGEVTGYLQQVMVDLQGLTTIGLERRVARREAEQVDLAVAWQEWQVAQQARLAVYRLAFLRRALALTRRTEEALDGDVAAVRRADSLHLVTAVSAAAAVAALEKVRRTRLDAELEMARTRLLLNQALGLPADTVVALQADSVASPALAVPDGRALRDSLTSRRLDLMALRRGYAGQEARVHAAILRQFPAISLGLVRTRDTGNFITLGPAVSVSLPFFDRNQGQIAVERATREQLRREYASRLFEARHAVDSLMVEHEAVQAQVEQAQRLAVVQRRLVAAYTEARRSSNADALVLFQARTELLDDEMAALRLEQTQAELEIAIEVASGTYFPRKSNR